MARLAMANQPQGTPRELIIRTARVVLNSVFLEQLVKAGMSSAIVHASKILPLAKIEENQQRVALDLIFDRRDTSAGGTGLPGSGEYSYRPREKVEA